MVSASGRVSGNGAVGGEVPRVEERGGGVPPGLVEPVLIGTGEVEGHRGDTEGVDVDGPCADSGIVDVGAVVPADQGGQLSTRPRRLPQHKG